MDIKCGKGRKFIKEGSTYNYVTAWSEIVLGRVIHEPKGNKYKVERKVNEAFVRVSSGHKDHLTAAKELVKLIG